jgi:hypothetical protein
MNSHGWKVEAAVRRQEPEGTFYVWREDGGHVTSHSLWVSDEMISKLRADELIGVFKRERLAEDIKISFRIRIEERGTEYRVSLVPRRSGEFKAQE